jgi:hypothetical protein
MGKRILIVREADSYVVRYLDGYETGECFERIGSRIQWDLDVEAGVLVPVTESQVTGAANA